MTQSEADGVAREVSTETGQRVSVFGGTSLRVRIRIPEAWPELGGIPIIQKVVDALAGRGLFPANIAVEYPE